MSIRKQILDWEEREWDKITMDKKADYVKALGLDMIESVVNSPVVLCPIVIGCACYLGRKALKK